MFAFLKMFGPVDPDVRVIANMSEQRALQESTTTHRV